jgi:hypothetical protein
MKRVKVMLSAILVLAIVGGALAFKAKSPDACAYARITDIPEDVTTCPSVDLGLFKTTVGTNNEYATTIAKPATGCPETTTCAEFLKTAAE